MILSEKIKTLRMANSLSQESIAMLLGVSRQSVSKWEKGLSKPSTENLMRLSEIFSVSIEDLMDENLQINMSYNTFPFFSDLLKRKYIGIPILVLLGLFIITLIISLYLQTIGGNRDIIFVLIIVSATCSFSAAILFLTTILRYVYMDCKIRSISPFFYVLISITILGFAYYLLRRDEIPKKE